MNRRSFFGLFGGAAVVPFVKMPDVEAGTKTMRRLVVADYPDLEFRPVRYGVMMKGDGTLDGPRVFTDAEWDEWGA